MHCRGVEEWSVKLKREKKPKTTTVHVPKVLNLVRFYFEHNGGIIFEQI